MSDKIIEIINLHYKYPNNPKRLLRGIDLEIESNSLVTIVGKVGSGKSTLLRMINGILTPNQGIILINGKEIQELKTTIHGEVGLLFENPEDQIFYPIVADDISFGPSNLQLSNTEVHKRVIDACQEVEILHLLERETSSLSFGEKTLVALAGILAMKPEIILMDSPTFGLDLWTKPKILNLLSRLKNEHTIIISTNDRDILQISDKILLLWNGKIRGIYQNYKTFKSAITRGKEEILT